MAMMMASSRTSTNTTGTTTTTTTTTGTFDDNHDEIIIRIPPSGDRRPQQQQQQQRKRLLPGRRPKWKTSVVVSVAAVLLLAFTGLYKETEMTIFFRTTRSPTTSLTSSNSSSSSSSSITAFSTTSTTTTTTSTPPPPHRRHRHMPIYYRHDTNNNATQRWNSTQLKDWIILIAANSSNNSNNINNNINTNNDNINNSTSVNSVKEEKEWNNNRITHQSKQVVVERRNNVMKFAPKPHGTDVEIYNMDLWHQLRVLLGLEEDEEEEENEEEGNENEIEIDHVGKRKRNTTTTQLVSIGGSATAGAGNVLPLERFDEVFASMIRATTTNNSNNNKTLQNSSSPTTTAKNDDDGEEEEEDEPQKTISVLNRGHGSRGSAHAGFLFHSLIPADRTDIILWEFAINDSVKTTCEEMNSALTIFLDQVARQSARRRRRPTSHPPPLVILVYLWDQGTPTQPRRHGGRIRETAFQCHHDRIAAEYKDFVVGSVNFASYLSNLEWNNHGLIKQSFLADLHHPNPMGHLILAFLLWDLAMDDQRLPINTTTTSSTFSPSTFSNITNTTATKAKNETTMVKEAAAGTTLAESRFSNSSTTRSRSSNWTWCSKDFPSNERLSRLPSENKFSFASWTADLPRNSKNDAAHDIVVDGTMLSPILSFRRRSSSSTRRPPFNSTFEYDDATTNDASTNTTTNISSKMVILTHGKTEESRQDRQQSILLPCCVTEERLEFDLSTKENNNESNNDTGGSVNNNNNKGERFQQHGRARGRHLSAFQMNLPGFRQHWYLPKMVLIELFDSNGELIVETKADQSSSSSYSLVSASNASGTGCWQGLLLSGQSWLVLANETWVSKISFCSRGCSADGGTQLSLEYLFLL